jgi:hypothetical protein
MEGTGVLVVESQQGHRTGHRHRLRWLVVAAGLLADAAGQAARPAPQKEFLDARYDTKLSTTVQPQDIPDR